MDEIAFWIGVALILVGNLQPWEMANPDAVFAFGMGLFAVPAIRQARELLKGLSR